MEPKDFQERYAGLRPKSKSTVARLLASYGRPFDIELSEMLNHTRAEMPDRPEFAVWMAEALVWARYAVRDAEFFTAAAAFLVDGDAESLDAAVAWPDRFGDERLRDALLGFHHWFEQMSGRLSSIKPEARTWKALQERSLQVAQHLKEEGQFHGIGVWLFPAPFKIMAVAHREMWGDPVLATVVMPTGTQVDRALRMLHDDRVVALEKEIVDGGESTFLDEYTNLWALQRPQQELAELGGTTLLHINGALHALGYRGPGW